MSIPGPDTRVVEFRIPGIHGTTGESLTDSIASVPVAGDGLGAIVRPADRLRRPSPGPLLRAIDRPVPRTVEGYVWSKLTSGGWAKATWALLFPFCLINMAHWMLPPVPARGWAGRLLGALLRALLRLAAVLLTVLFVGQLAVVSLDLIAGQCFAPGSRCEPAVSAWWRDLPYTRVLVGLLPVLVTVLVLHRVSAVRWRVNRGRNTVDQPDPSGAVGRLPGASLVADPHTPLLRAMHTVAALNSVALLALGGPFRPARPEFAPPWIVALTLLGIALVGVLVLDDPRNAKPWLADDDPPRPRRPRQFAAVRRLLIGVSLVVFGVTGWLIHPLDTTLVGVDDTMASIGAAFAMVAGLVAVLLVPAALLARPAWSRLPRRLRPWAGGWMAAPVVVIGGWLGAGFGVGVAIGVRQWLGSDLLVLPVGYHALALLWGAVTTLGVATVALVAPVLLLAREIARRRGTIAPEVTLLHAGRGEEATRAARSWWWATLQRRHLHRAVLWLFVLLTGCTGGVAVVELRQIALPGWAGYLSGLGVLALGGLAVGFLRAVYQAARQPAAARRLAVLTELVGLWPREAHPIVPPCYALKIVPEVLDRVRLHLADPTTRVVLAGHSQGGLLAVVVASRLLRGLPAEERQRIGLVTAGSPLQSAYPRAFPAVVSHASLARLAGLLGGRWRALCRGTDPLGGAVCSWNRQVYGGKLLGEGYRSNGSEGPLAAATRAPNGALVLGGDHWLPDPARGPFAGRRWRPGVLGHADYLFDPEWDHAVAIAAGLEPITAQDGQPPGMLPTQRHTASAPGEPAPSQQHDSAPTQ